MYGFPPKGTDPRDYTPDPEACTDTELHTWKIALAEETSKNSNYTGGPPLRKKKKRRKYKDLGGLGASTEDWWR